MPGTRKDLERSALMMGKIKNPSKKETTYDGGMEAEGYDSYASKTTKKGGNGRKQITKTTKIVGGDPSSSEVYSRLQTLTKTKTVRKNNTETTKIKQKEVKMGRASKIKKKIRKNARVLTYVSSHPLDGGDEYQYPKVKIKK
jgi:hypothetical protein